MKVLVCGAQGFIGQNLVAELRNRQNFDVLTYGRGQSEDELFQLASEADFVFNLVGVNRTNDPSDFMKGNFGFAEVLLDALRAADNRCPVMFSSSIQAELDNDYGRSKVAGEELYRHYAAESGAKVTIYRLTNIFGKWGRPNYNGVVATFCYNVARDLPISIHDPLKVLNLVYIDDLLRELMACLEGRPHLDEKGFAFVPVSHSVSLGQIAELIQSFRQSRRNLVLPDCTPNSFSSKLYSTYLSYLPQEDFAYPLKRHADARGSFTEILRSVSSGQVSVNVAKPGIEKGNHWHHSKNEKFIVVSGEGLIQFRRIGDEEVISYPVSAEHPSVVDIPTGYTHNIVNTGTVDLVTVMWVNECYNPEVPDTYFEAVNQND